MTRRSFQVTKYLTDWKSYHTMLAMKMAIQCCHNNHLVINEAKSKPLALEVVIDKYLSWSRHIDNFCKKLGTGGCTLLKWIKKLVARKLLQIMHFLNRISVMASIYRENQVHKICKELYCCKKVHTNFSWYAP